MNHRAKYLGQRPFRSKVVSQTHTHTLTHTHIDRSLYTAAKAVGPVTTVVDA